MSGAAGGGTDLVFSSRRSPVAARGGMAASSQPLASRAGLRVLEDGGTAADAAVAMAAVLNVTEPCSTGIGGDCFALYYEAASRKITALNGSGRAPTGLSIELVRRQGLVREEDGVARFADPCHAHSVTVPGACAGWCDLLARHGTIGIARALAPAIRLAEEGFPVAPLTSHHWGRGAEGVLARASGGKALTIDGRGPRPGEVFRNPGLARTFREVAAGGADAFYRGEIADDLAAAVQGSGGVMTVDDLAVHRSTWDEPIGVEYRGVRVWECPPNGQGIAALVALGILDGLDLAELPGLSVDRWHLVVEAVRLAFADALAFVADPSAAAVPAAGLLSGEYLAARRALVDRSRALPRVEAGVRRQRPRLLRPAVRIPSTSARWMGEATPVRSSTATTWDSARASCPRGVTGRGASRCRTVERTSLSIPRIPTHSPPASGRTTPSSPA